MAVTPDDDPTRPEAGKLSHSDKVAQILTHLKPLREFGKLLKIGVEERKKYFTKVKSKIQEFQDSKEPSQTLSEKIKSIKSYKDIALYETWLKDQISVPESHVQYQAKYSDFYSRSPFGQLLMMLGDEEFKMSEKGKQISDSRRKDLQKVIEEILGKNLRDATKVAQSVAAFHVDGFVHGDIKARNIMISDDGCTLLDFGTSGRIDHISSSILDGRSDSPIDSYRAGTANFFPPEFMDGSIDKEGRRIVFPSTSSDVYQMATVCFNYSHTDTFARVNVERFIFSSQFIDLPAGFYTTYFNTGTEEEKNRFKQAYIDFIISGSITLKPLTGGGWRFTRIAKPSTIDEKNGFPNLTLTRPGV